MRFHFICFITTLMYQLTLSANPSPSRIVTLNIGGTSIQTHRETLTSAPGTAISTMFSTDMIPGELTPEGVFIDEDIEYINPILHWLRHRKCLLKDFDHAYAVFNIAGIWCHSMQDDICRWAISQSDAQRSHWAHQHMTAQKQQIKLKRCKTRYRSEPGIRRNFWQLEPQQELPTYISKYRAPFAVAQLYLDHFNLREPGHELIYFADANIWADLGYHSMWIIEHFLLNLSNNKRITLSIQKICQAKLDQESIHKGKEILSSKLIEKSVKHFICVQDPQSLTSYDGCTTVNNTPSYLILDTKQMEFFKKYRFKKQTNCHSFIQDLAYDAEGA